MIPKIYLDHAATAPLDDAVAAFLREAQGKPLNPSSVHGAGQRARRRLEAARERLAAAVGAEPEQVLFTSGASEANNLVLRGLADRHALDGRRPPRVLWSSLEHPCIRETVRHLGAMGRIEGRALPVTEGGRVDFAAAPAGDLLTMMTVQNETGVCLELREAREWRDAHRALWHTDAAQVLGRVPFSLRETGADLVTFSSHKIGGPAGIGALAGRALQRLSPQVTGGPQEQERRAGTQPVLLAEAFALAAERAAARVQENEIWQRTLESALFGALAAAGIFPFRNGLEPRAPGFLNLTFPGVSGPDLVIALDARGIAVSSGAACSTGVMELSEALAAMFPQDPERAAGALRITPGMKTTLDDVQALAEALVQILPRAGLRS